MEKISSASSEKFHWSSVKKSFYLSGKKTFGFPLGLFMGETSEVFFERNTKIIDGEDLNSSGVDL